MIANRNKKYFAERKTGNNQPITRKEEVPHSNDNKIDQDFPGFPFGQSKENIINPVTENDKKTADINNKDGEKINHSSTTDEGLSDASGGAFNATENVKE